MPIRGLQARNGQNAARLRVCAPDPTRDAKAVPARRRPVPPDRDLEGALSSAMLVADKELGEVVREVDRISSALRADANDSQAVRVAVHPAVWCAVKHVLLERELRYLALTDDLTCLYNRRGFFAAATHQLKLARRNGQSMLLLFCDVDRLKEINDSFGHREGDLALARVADVLEQCFRDSDILARLAGDEFAVLAPEASDQNLEMLLRRLGSSLEKTNANEPRYELSISVGAARFDPQCPLALGELMAEADQAMYEQKRRVPKLVVHRK
jgi:diguanylate cyclase (GGDEF)-like protein